MLESIFLAKVFGVYLFIMSVMMLARPKRFVDGVDQMIKCPCSLWLAGSLFLLLGLVLVNGHNVWVMNWPVIITLLGWMLVLKWTAFMVVPDKMLALSARMNREGVYQLTGAIFFIVSMVLLFNGYTCR